MTATTNSDGEYECHGPPCASFYDNITNTTAGCMDRCVASVQNTTSFYIKSSHNGWPDVCGCSLTTSGACPLSHHGGYSAYEIVPALAPTSCSCVACGAPFPSVCRDHCSPSGSSSSQPWCTQSWCDHYKPGGALHSRCDSNDAGHQLALDECKETCGLCPLPQLFRSPVCAVAQPTCAGFPDAVCRVCFGAQPAASFILCVLWCAAVVYSQQLASCPTPTSNHYLIHFQVRAYSKPVMRLEELMSLLDPPPQRQSVSCSYVRKGLLPTQQHMQRVANAMLSSTQIV